MYPVYSDTIMMSLGYTPDIHSPQSCLVQTKPDEKKISSFVFYTSVSVYYKDSMKSFVHLQLLQFSGVSLTLAGLRFHLVLVFLLLVQSLGLLPALLLPGELTTRETQREMRVSERRTGHIQAIRESRFTCLVFSRSSAELPLELILRLFLNMAMRVLASLRWILGSLFFSCCCRALRSSIIRWL